MPTFTALTTLKGVDPARELGEAMERLQPAPTGVGVIEVEDGAGLWEVGGYFVEAPDEVGLSLLAAAYGARPFVVSELPEVDWVSKVRRELAPVHAGRFFLYGSHDADKVPQDVVALAIDAAMAFGTGHHGTTQGCLIAFDALLNDGKSPENIADIGCGTAVLAMAAAKTCPKARIIASDMDEIAIETTRANLEFNDLQGSMECVVCAGFEHEVFANASPFDLVFANILMSPLIDLAADMAKAIAANGYVILSGILNEQADSVIKAYQAQGFALVTHLKRDEWSTLTMQKNA